MQPAETLPAPCVFHVGLVPGSRGCQPIGATSAYGDAIWSACFLSVIGRAAIMPYSSSIPMFNAFPAMRPATPAGRAIEPVLANSGWAIALESCAFAGKTDESKAKSCAKRK